MQCVSGVNIFLAFMYCIWDLTYIHVMNSKWNINNVSVNIYLSPLFITIQYFILKKFSPFDANVSNLIISLFVYIFSSMFFQPDLDQHPNKPGKETFPLGTYLFPIVSGVFASILMIGVKRARRLLYCLLWPINRFWFYLWMPYGVLLTHRGISHLPIIGVMTRIYYLKALFYFMNFYPVIDFNHFLDNFFFWDLRGSYKNFIIFCLPVFVSDFFHILVDFIESKVKGFDFCPPKIPRGWMAKLLNPLKYKS